MTDQNEGHLSVARVVYTRFVVKEGIYTAVTQNPFLVRQALYENTVTNMMAGVDNCTSLLGQEAKRHPNSQNIGSTDGSSAATKANSTCLVMLRW